MTKLYTRDDILELFTEWSGGSAPYEADDEQQDAFLSECIPEDADKLAFRTTFEALCGEEDEPEDEPEDDEAGSKHSVVGAKYKQKYIERAATVSRARAKGIPKKALKRSTNDWLAIELARRTLDEKAHISVSAFEAILDANGVKHDHWNRTTRGWQGRLRMTGRLALQRIVAENGELKLPDGEAIPAPKSWVHQHTH